MDNEGALLLKNNRFDEAIEYFLKVIRQDEKNFDAYLKLSAALDSKNRIQEALEVTENALRIFPKFKAFLLGAFQLEALYTLYYWIISRL